MVLDNLRGVGVLDRSGAALLLIGWVIYVTATRRSLGLLGVGLLVALFAALMWLPRLSGQADVDQVDNG